MTEAAMELSDWTLVLPGPLSRTTGGTIYDRRIVEGARSRGLDVRVVELPGDDYPRPCAASRSAADEALAQLPDGECVAIDGLALGALPELARQHGSRLHLAALVHHPLCDEGDGGERASALHASEREALKHVQQIIVTSPFTAHRLRELALSPPGVPIEVVEPGVDRAPESEIWQPGAELRVLSVGSLTPRKAHADALAAWVSAAARTEPPWRWTLIGPDDHDPGCAAQLRDAISSSGLGPRVDVMGELSDADLAAELHRSHLLLHPAHYEGFGMAIVEAAARAIPVLTSRGGALDETFRRRLGAHGGANGGANDRAPNERFAGASFAPGDVDALAGSLVQVLESPTQWPAWREIALEARQALGSWQDASDAFCRSLQAHFKSPQESR